MREKEKYFILRSTYSFGNGILFELRGLIQDKLLLIIVEFIESLFCVLCFFFLFQKEGKQHANVGI